MPTVEKKQVHCEIVIPKHRRHGTYANAFRVLPDGGEFLLDFLIYTQQENSAVVVSRVRLSPNVLAAVKDRLSTFMSEAGKDPSPVFLAKGSGEIQ